MLYLYGFYNEISELSLCKLTVTDRKSVQLLQMIRADNSRQIMPGIHSHTAALDRKQGRKTGSRAHLQQSHHLKKKNLPVHVCCGTPWLWAHVMCDDTVHSLFLLLQNNYFHYCELVWSVCPFSDLRAVLASVYMLICWVSGCTFFMKSILSCTCSNWLR